jgi:hypothetical protein
MRLRVLGHLVCATLLGCAVGCDADAPGGAPPAQGRLELRSDVLADTDVAGFRYTATAVDCATGAELVGPAAFEAVEDLVDAFVPGGSGALEDAPFDADSGHLFADHFFSLPEGCYDVTAQPIDADGEPSSDCTPATRRNVPVVDGETTEIVLISQCANDPAGGLDAIAIVNHAPQIVGLSYSPSKFVCDRVVQVCLEVTDPDGDPLSVTAVPADPRVRLGRQSSRINAAGNAVYCTTYTFTAPGDYVIEATVHDMGWNGAGDLVTIESLLAAQGDPHPSNDRIAFPVHVLDADACIGDICVCPDGFQLNAAGDACEREAAFQPRINGPLVEVCAGDRETVYGALGARFPGGLTVTNGFFGTDFASLDGRLNTIGVWACGPGGQAGGPSGRPFREWVGFSACLSVPADGEYVIGIAADNQARFRIDGAQVFLHANPISHDNFRRWEMLPVALTAGDHTVELEALNDSDQGVFGAEIYGPFPAGSTANDAAMAALDYPNNIIWTTGDRVQSSFHLGEDSGFSCPDGLALNVCAGAGECTGTQRAACE